MVLDYALKPVRHSLGAQTILKGIFIEDRWIVKIILDEVEKTTHFYNEHPDKTAQLLAKQIGMDLKPVKKAITRSKYGLEPLDDDIIKEQQQIADTFYAEGLIPENVEKVIWSESRKK